MKNDEKLDLFIGKSRDNMVDAIIDLIGFPSINGRKEENSACLEHFLNLARTMSFNTMATSDFDVGIVEMGQGNETLGILVHLDVVDIGDPEKWTNNPFEGVERDGYIWGRGSVDDKGAAVMSLYAMEAVKRLGLPFNRKVWLIVGTSEEGQWTDIENFKKEFPPPDFGFSPDGDFPIFNAEKGYADVELLFFRDAGKRISFLGSGDSTNTIPSKAEIAWDDGRRISIQGISAHSSAPELGDNAIVKLCQVLSDNELEKGTVATEENIPASIMSGAIIPGAIISGGAAMDFVDFTNELLSGDGYGDRLKIDDGGNHYGGEYVGTTTAVPTVLSLDEEGVRLIINIRHRFGTSLKEILSAFAAHSDKYGYRFSIKEYLDPIYVSSELPFLKIMCRIHEEFNVPCSFKVAAGTSYAKAMDNFVSWGPIFEGEPSCAHAEDERLSVSSMLLATKLYAGFISRMTVDEGEQI